MKTKTINTALEQRKEAFLWLQSQFPATFPSKAMPLKIGIFEEICALNIADSPKEIWIKKALRYYVNSTRYLRQMKTGNPRIDLKGNHSGLVREQDEVRANELLAIYQERQRIKNTKVEKSPPTNNVAQLTETVVGEQGRKSREGL
ncbi:MAG: ProQ/FinO family protein [Tatlockia sp.]|nr:ProQ/FinO family protein [Tatlockia sp.]